MGIVVSRLDPYRGIAAGARLEGVHARLASIGLRAIAPYAVAFSQAVNCAIGAYRDEGFQVDVEVHGEVFARLRLIDATGTPAKVELACDWRAHPPVQLAIGPVLHADDAVANKVTALFGRAAPRDYIDVHAALASGRYTPEQLLALAKENDDGSTHSGPPER